MSYPPKTYAIDCYAPHDTAPTAEELAFLLNFLSGRRHEFVVRGVEDAEYHETDGWVQPPPKHDWDYSEEADD